MRIAYMTLLGLGLVSFGCGTSKNSTETTLDENPSISSRLTSIKEMESKEDVKKGWISLFDGKTTKGWHVYNKPGAPVEGWKVVDGALTFDPAAKQKGDLITDQEFTNFHLKIEWKISPGGNSGIIFYVHEDPKYKNTYLTGPEMQVLDNEAHSDGKIHKHRSGDLYDLIASSSEPVKPVGEWNLAEIISKDGNLTLKLNGVEVVKTTMWNENWKELIAGSKFKSWEGFGTYKTGRIALQDHGNVVSFRKIEIKKL